MHPYVVLAGAHTRARLREHLTHMHIHASSPCVLTIEFTELDSRTEKCAHLSAL